MASYHRIICLATAVALMSLSAANAAAISPSVTNISGLTTESNSAQEVGRLYLVQLSDPPVAAYTGGIQGFDAANENPGHGTFDAASPSSLAYHEYLVDSQGDVLEKIEKAIGRRVGIAFSFTYAANGFAALLTQEEARVVATLPGVILVEEDVEYELDTDAGPAWIGAQSVYTGDTSTGVGTRGEGVIIGMFDTGINADHLSFADVGGDGYNHTNPFGAGVYVGVCNPSNVKYQPSFPCNDKLIGAWSYVTEFYTPEDSHGHGSHTASTAAGNVVSSVIAAPTTTITNTISGVAPHANIIAYDVCTTTCPASALLAATNQAIIDGVDVINYSISGSDEPWLDLQEQAFLNAFNAGIVVVTSAGNSGPTARTAAHSSPWVISTAASTHNRVFMNSLINLTGGAPMPDLAGAGVTAGYGPAPIVHAEAFGNPLCLVPFPAGTFKAGEIVVCDRGVNGRIQKGSNVLAGGAGGMVLANQDENGESINADAHVLPAVHIGDAAGDALRSWLAASLTGPEGTPALTATISGFTANIDASNGDIIADFSSRGPSSYDILSPGLAAPGVDIWAADCDVNFGTCGTTDPEFRFMSGTSMASPHAAGAAALLVSLNPSWTPDMVRSALQITSVPPDRLRLQDGVTPATPFDAGAGRVDVGAAARTGFVLKETGSNFSAANPFLGGNPRTLNVPGLVDSICRFACTFTRTVTSALPFAVDWSVSTEALQGGWISVVPAGFRLEPGDSQEIVITVYAGNATMDDWKFGNVWFEPVASQAAGAQNPGAAQSMVVPKAHFPVAVKFISPIMHFLMLIQR